MTCVEIREILSDLIDVRNGEIPPAGASRLAVPGTRADAESHLAACSECRTELAILESVGSVFADFNVGELPAQYFADYGQVVRRRMKDQDRKIVPIRAATGSRWWKTGAAAAAAACLAFAAVHFSPIVKPKKITSVAVNKLPPVPYSTRSTPIQVFRESNGIMPVAEKKWIYNPQQPKGMLDALQNEEGRAILVFGEAVAPKEMPLFGVRLRAMQDQDTDLSKSRSLGLKIHDIIPDSVANEMGLMQNDIIVCINGLNVNSGSVEDAVHFLAAIDSLGKGTAITIDVLREDKSGVLYIQRSGVLGEPKAVIDN